MSGGMRASVQSESPVARGVERSMRAPDQAKASVATEVVESMRASTQERSTAAIRKRVLPAWIQVNASTAGGGLRESARSSCTSQSDSRGCSQQAGLRKDSSLDSRERKREEAELDPVVRARTLTGVFANAARAHFNEGSHRSLVERVKESHRGKFNKKNKPHHEEMMRDSHMTTLSAMFSRSKRDRESLPSLVEMLMHTQAVGTTNTYSSSWLRFITWCTTIDKSTPMPAAHTTVMRYMSYLFRDATEKGLSSANIKAAVSAISAFHEQYNVENPPHHPFVKLLLKGANRALGTRGVQKKALLNRDMRVLFEKWVAPDPLDVVNVAHMLRMALCQEGLLRYDELANVKFSDILITDTCLHIFIWESKTDRERKGQWAQIYKDAAPWKAYSLLTTFVDALQHQFNLLRKHPWALNKWSSMIHTDPATRAVYLAINDLPVMCSFQAVFAKWRKRGKPKIYMPALSGHCVKYDTYRKQIKTWVDAIGLDKEDYSTHSLRRGGASMLRLTGLSDAQIMTAGRWKTCSVMKDYIDWEVDLALRVRGARLASRA